MGNLGNYILPLILGIVDVVVVYAIYNKIKKQTNDFDLFRLKKMILTLMISIVITSQLGLSGTSLILTVVLGIYPVLTFIAYPQEFRNLLDDISGRKITNRNKDRLLSEEGIEEVAEAIVRNYRKTVGCVFIITATETLTDIENSGLDLGEVNISADFLETATSHTSTLNKGAFVIRDNKLVTANAKMPIAYNEQVERAGGGNKHFGILGTISSSDAIVIATSGQSGAITIGGTRPEGDAYFRFLIKMTEHDTMSGISKEEIKNTLRTLVSGVGNPEDFAIKQQKELERKQALEEKMQRKIEKTLNAKSQEEKIAEREEARRKKREEKNR